MTVKNNYDLFPQYNNVFLVENNNDILSYDVEKDFLYLHIKTKNNNKEFLRVLNIKNGNLINNFILKDDK